MDDEKRSELNLAYHTLVEHNLYRRGKTKKESTSPKEIGDAIDTAAGGILDFLECEIQYGINEASLELCEKELKRVQRELDQQEAITLSTKQMLDDAKKEIIRLKAILSSNRIGYKAEFLQLSTDIFRRVENNPQWKFASVNADDSANFWRTKPEIKGERWVGKPDGKGQTWRRCMGRFDASDWKNSLVEREEKKNLSNENY